MFYIEAENPDGTIRVVTVDGPTFSTLHSDRWRIYNEEVGLSTVFLGYQTYEGFFYESLVGAPWLRDNHNDFPEKMRRYKTRADAIKGHKQWVHLLRNGVPIENLPHELPTDMELLIEAATDDE